VIALAGAGTMIVELAAVRLLAPWFGASAGVWTNVIGVILLALALGYLVGGRLARGARAGGSFAAVLLLAGLFTAWLPRFAALVCEQFLPENLSLHDSARVFGWGSLASTLLLFLPPAVFLGCVGPLGVELLQRRTGSCAGAAGGRVLAASTVGSLVGTFATTHVLIPIGGLQATFAGTGLLLGGLGIALAFAIRRGRWLAAGPGAVLILVPWLWPWNDDIGRFVLRLGAPAGVAQTIVSALDLPRVQPRMPDGVSLLRARESAYQSIRVVETSDGGGILRQLQVNEGLDSFQSVWRPEPGLLGEGYYYDLFALPAWWSGADGPWRVLAIGLGAGTAFRVIQGASPAGCAPELVGLEIDPEVVALGRKWCELPDEGPTVRVGSGLDGRAALRALAGEAPFDLAVLDAYAAQVEIPAHLSTVEFFGEVRERLAPGGWLAVNVGGFGFDDPVVAAVGATLAAAFEGDGRVLGLRVPSARNYVLLARREAEPPEPLGPGWAFEGEVGRALLPALELPGAWAWMGREEGPILTDDRNPMQRLQALSLALGRR